MALSLRDVYAARRVVYRTLRPTPLLQHPLLNQATGLDLFVKHENHNPTNAFKVRGGLNLIAGLSGEERRGVLTASTGNHGQSIAMACQRESVPCTVVVPEGNNPDKNAAMRAYGATVLEIGKDFDEAREYVERVVSERGLRYVHSANEPMLIAGVATYALELFEELPDADVVLVPIGGGSGACGCSLVRTWTGSRARVIGVQAAGADAFTRSWRTGQRVTTETADTFAEGIATRTTFDLTYEILREHLDDIITLEEQELMDGIRLALSTTHNLAEGAGAASIAAAVKLRDELRGKKVACVMSGANITEETLTRVLGDSGLGTRDSGGGAEPPSPSPNPRAPSPRAPSSYCRSSVAKKLASPRCTSSSAGRDPFFSAALRPPASLTGFRSTSTMTSPGRSPASAARPPDCTSTTTTPDVAATPSSRALVTRQRLDRHAEAGGVAGALAILRSGRRRLQLGDRHVDGLLLAVAEDRQLRRRARQHLRRLRCAGRCRPRSTRR